MRTLSPWSLSPWSFLLLLLLLFLPSVAVADRNSPEFQAYQNRLKERRVYAQKLKVERASMRPPARVWTANRYPVSVSSIPRFGPSAIQQGRVYYPPIYPRRFRNWFSW